MMFVKVGGGSVGRGGVPPGLVMTGKKTVVGVRIFSSSTCCGYSARAFAVKKVVISKMLRIAQLTGLRKCIVIAPISSADSR